MSVIGSSISLLDHLMQDINVVFDDLETRAAPLRQALLDEGYILKISQDRMDASVITVDGASIVQQMAFGDLMSTCAVAAEGTRPRYIMDASKGPTLVNHMFVRDHSSDIDIATSAIMAIQEMMLMEHEALHKHDLKIIDGSWTSALVSFLKVTLRSKQASKLLNDYLNSVFEEEAWTQDALIAAVTRRMTPVSHADYHNGNYTIAISKSDSQRSYADFLKDVGISEELIQGLSDRTLSHIVLKPGEMLVPAKMNMNARMIQTRNGNSQSTGSADMLASWQALQDTKLSQKGTIEHVYERLIDLGVYSSRGDLVSPALTGLSNNHWLWSTYLKPSNYHEHARPIKVDFPREVSVKDNLTEDEANVIAQETLNNILSRLNQEFIEGYQEPFAQYNADVQAKGLSTASKYLRDHIIASTNDQRIISGMIRNYRT